MILAEEVISTSKEEQLGFAFDLADRGREKTLADRRKAASELYYSEARGKEEQNNLRWSSL